METWLIKITKKKQRLDKYQPLKKEVIEQLESWLRIELTYSSNAIEGNSLSRLETAEIIEKGITTVISGKPIKDQLEAINHARAIEFIKKLVRGDKKHWQINENDIRAIHRIILTGIDDQWAGRYRQTEIFVKGSNVEFPQPEKISRLMGELVDWLQRQKNIHSVKAAAEAHHRLVTIHPFVDGNGRTARLLMNLILIMDRYPMAIIRNEERLEYLNSLQRAQLKGDKRPFNRLMAEAVNRSLSAYLNMTMGKPAISALTKIKNRPSQLEDKNYSEFLKIGELAKETNETIHTLRYWTKEGLLSVGQYTEGGYQLYSPVMIKRAKEIRRLQKEKRLTIKEIKELMK